MDKHKRKLSGLCRLCQTDISTRDNKHKHKVKTVANALSPVLRLGFFPNEDPDVYPEHLCTQCKNDVKRENKRYLKIRADKRRSRSGPDLGTLEDYVAALGGSDKLYKKPKLFLPHSINCALCIEEQEEGRVSPQILGHSVSDEAEEMVASPSPQNRGDTEENQEDNKMDENLTENSDTDSATECPESQLSVSERIELEGLQIDSPKAVNSETESDLDDTLTANESTDSASDQFNTPIHHQLLTPPVSRSRKSSTSSCEENVNASQYILTAKTPNEYWPSPIRHCI